MDHRSAALLICTNSLYPTTMAMHLIKQTKALTENLLYLSESNINRKMFRNHDHTYAKIQETEFEYVSRIFEITSLCEEWESNE